MDCPNCGEKLRDANQNFCSNCGYEISTIFKSPQLRTERDQYTSTSDSQPTLESFSPQIIKQKEINNSLEAPGVHSKKCLAYSIISIILAQVFGTYSLFFFMFPVELIRTIVVHIASSVGLGFGIFAEINGSEARKLEPQNHLEKVGRVLPIIGMLRNNITICFIILIVISC